MDLSLTPISRFALELLLAAFLGGVVGLEREMHGQAAGLRTNILICVAACLLMHLSLNMEAIFGGLGQDSAVRIDPGRIASYAVAGMGFLGAGAIMKGPSMIRGLTTAAGLWLVTGVGLAIGCGLYIPALVTVAIAIVVLYSLRTFKSLFLREVNTRIILKVDEKLFHLNQVEEIMGEERYTRINFINYRKDLVHQTARYDFRVTSKGDEEWREITEALVKVPGVLELAWEEITSP